MMTTRILNLNVGILGHVDSGKTSLARAISTIASTAAFDKHPEAQRRGITIDLGFSCRTFEIDDDDIRSKFDHVQLSLMDCPGHASLIRAVIGGAQVLDMVLLVIDVVKGIQTQTAECLILADITCPTHMIVVLNKIDLLIDDEARLDKFEKRLRTTLRSTLSFADVPIVRVAANPSTGIADVDQLLKALQNAIYIPKRVESSTGPFVMAVDHCFVSRGHGTILTGIVVSGSVKIGDSIIIPTSNNEQRKIRSLQSYRRTLTYAQQGDRLAIGVGQLDSDRIERTQIGAVGAIVSCRALMVSMTRITHFKSIIESKSRFHISIGYETVMAVCTFMHGGAIPFDLSSEYEYCDQLTTDDSDSRILCLLEFDHPVFVRRHHSPIYIASKLDTDIHTHTCRIAFHGNVQHYFIDTTTLGECQLFKRKRREGIVERIADELTIIAHSLFKKQTQLDRFVTMIVQLSTGERGRIESAFGQSGKVRIRLIDNLAPTTIECIQLKSSPIRVILSMKKFVFDGRLVAVIDE